MSDGDVIILDEGTTIDITLSSSNGFNLKNTTKSWIPYKVKKNTSTLLQGSNVLHYEAGLSDNTGVYQELEFQTTAENIKRAKLTGQHTDVITFTID